MRQLKVSIHTSEVTAGINELQELLGNKDAGVYAKTAINPADLLVNVNPDLKPNALKGYDVCGILKPDKKAPLEQVLILERAKREEREEGEEPDAGLLFITGGKLVFLALNEETTRAAFKDAALPEGLFPLGEHIVQLTRSQ